MPDPFVIAILLTMLTAGLALVQLQSRGDEGVLVSMRTILDGWGGESGLWRLLGFSMQMVLILVTGHALAATRAVGSLIRGLARWPRSTGQAAVMVSVVACCCGIVNWGLGLIVGAMLAREVGRSLAWRGVRAHYPSIVAAGYMGMLVWHGGFSGSAPLSMTTADGARKVLPAAYVESAGAVPLTETLLTPMNMVITGGLVILAPVMLWLLSPRRPEEMEPIPEAMLRAEPMRTPESAGETIPERMDRGPWMAWLLAAALVASLLRYAQVKSFANIGLNEVNMGMLAAGLVLHGSIRSYVAAAEEAIRGCLGIVLQFPLYGGIMGIMIAAGLVESWAQGIGGAASARTLPLYTFVSAAVVNLFVPSGGGQWAVQGPIALESALALGVPPGKVIMAVAYGDQLTNMLQPFWALPLLAITGAKAREIVGYAAVVMVVGAVWMGVGLVVF
jgi:short-chain fatty acids transporter